MPHQIIPLNCRSHGCLIFREHNSCVKVFIFKLQWCVHFWLQQNIFFYKMWINSLKLCEINDLSDWEVSSCDNVFVMPHYNDVIMSAMVSQITSITIVYSTLYSGADQRKHQSSASLAFVRGIHRWPVNSPHKGHVTRKIHPLDDVTTQLWKLCVAFPTITDSHFGHKRLIITVWNHYHSFKYQSTNIAYVTTAGLLWPDLILVIKVRIILICDADYKPSNR